MKRLAVLAGATLLAGILGGGQALAQTTWFVNDGSLEDAPCDVAPNYATIQGAVNGASPDDTILVCPGTYTEQVTVATDDLSLMSVTPLLAIIDAPLSMASPEAVVHVAGATGVSIRDFTITGPTTGGAIGIYVSGNGDATVDGNEIDGFVQGIWVGRAFWSAVGTATITNNEIVGYYKGGIVVDNAGSDATISENVTEGAGPTPFVAQNGIQVSRGATAGVKRNEVTGNWFPGVDWSATGILVFETDDVMIQRNTLTDNEVGVFIAAYGYAAPGSNGNRVIRNTVTGSSTAVAIDARAGYWGPNPATAENNKVTNNTLSCNGGDNEGVWIGSGANNNKVIHNTINCTDDIITGSDDNAKVHANVID